jgi:hypothetical protein
MPGYTGLGRTGSWPGPENDVTGHSFVTFKFGRWEIEGDSANPGKPV